MGFLGKIFHNKDNDKDELLVLSTEQKNITNPTYKQVVEHIKGVYADDKFIGLSYRIDGDEKSYLKAYPNENNKDYNIEYFLKEDGDSKYLLEGSDVEQTMCFFRDFLEMHKLIKFDLENNDWKKI